ncbi:MAG TPA: response regulator transcription factor [Candidatus Olsenella avistercoris]|nr:response regulator transcription factor [Candidatus Olsenella avistercoris]
MTRVLLVEDEEKLARFVELELAHEGYEVTWVADGRSAVDRALDVDFDLVLLDILLPQLNGMEVLRRIRREKDVPVIMLTARDAVMDKVAGLDAGADDYVTKPFAIEELLARVRVALKRHAPAAPPEPDAAGVLAACGVTLDPERHVVSVRDEPVELTNREFEVLRALMEHPGRVLTRVQLAQEALGYDYVGETNVVDVHIAHLRAKLDDRFGVKLITTVRGVGYVVREG